MARDADVGSNSLLTYQLTDNPAFTLAVKENPGGKKHPELVLESALDREKQSSFQLVLTAVDSGNPVRSGTVQVRINVTDANDNAPVFTKSVYETRVRENVPAGSLVLRVRATDADAGTNGWVSYTFDNVPEGVRVLFSVHSESGEVRTAGPLDFEEKSKYSFGLEARDGGGLTGHCEVQIYITDENDNAPEITILSVSSPVPEDASAGTVVALLNVNDPDSEENGEVSCELSSEAPLSLVSSSGGSYKVVTASALDREQVAEHRVTVVARDRGRPSLSSSTALVLEVSDVNDNAPVFEEAAYSAYVAENNAAGAPVLRVLALDPDAGANGRVSYWLSGGSADAAAYVSVEARSGALYAQRSFDYEQCREFAVVVRAQDGGEPARSSTATVRVFVLDRNDNAPRVLWPAPEAGERVPGSAPALEPFEVVPRSAEAGYLVAKVVAVDADAGRNAWLSYELVQAAEPALFRVGLHSGEVRTARAVSERDAAKQRKDIDVLKHAQGRATKLVTVLVAAWEAAWGQLHYSIPEEMPKGSFVGDVATDLGLQLPTLRDRGVRIIDRGRTQYFALHGKTGHLVTAERIDREQLCASVQQCVLRCEVIVEGEMQIYEIEVEITDINDNAPSFKEVVLEERISEMTAPGSRFPLAGAHDPDSGPNSVQSYELSGDEHFSLAVQTGPGGDQRPELVLAKALDREEAAFHELVLRASDGGEPARTGTARIRVAVLDANDNAPVFSQAEYTVRVPEDVPVGSTLVTVIATDPDAGLNGHVKYSLKKITEIASQIFQLDSETGAITLVRSLDFEEGDTYEVEVQARDGGELFDTAKFVITVTDVNDNPPELTVMSQLSEVSEDSPSGTVVALLHVQDWDSGPNGEVRCSLDGDVPFRLHRSRSSYYSVVTARELDREQVSEYNVTVRAVDGGSPALWSSAVLWLRVLDVNDNAPVFAEARYSARLPENNAAGALVLRVRAWDADWGQNARVRYRLGEGRLLAAGSGALRGVPASHFVGIDGVRAFLHSYSHEVSLTADSRKSQLRFSGASCCDTLPARPPPDEPAPLLGEDPAAPPVPYLCPTATRVGRSQDFCLYLRGQEVHLLLGADGADSRQLLRERGAWQVLPRMAGGQRRRRAGGRVLLPALLLGLCWRAAAERLRYTIPEELGRGSLVGPLARDLGLSPADLSARKLRLASAAKRQLQYFTVSGENGNLYVSERLDREEMCGEAASCSVSFEVLVQNPLNVFHVEVAIQDVNDNAPRFLRDNFQLQINEFTSPGARFALGMAEDADVGSNSLQGYALEANGYFAVEVKRSPEGNKFAELVLEREPSLRLVLTALDGGDPPRSGTAQLCINVTDANDNAPVFAQDRYRASLREDAPPGSTVLNVSASDADSGTNARITYVFGQMPAKVLKKFVVDVESGMIILKETLDFEDTSGYTLLVEARDGGGLLAHCEVDVEVLDVNDNEPEMTLTSVSSPVPADAPVGTVVALLNVYDPDSRENGEVSCELLGEAPLSLVASSGGSYKVVTASALDREQAAEHRVTVVARDRGRPSLSSSTALVLEVSDVNDNAPVFEEAAYSAYVAENNAAGAPAPVLRVLAQDADSGANGRVSYWLESGSADAAAYVSVEARSGALYAQRSFDYEQCREFAVVVRAQDGGEPARSSTATVRVFVLDRNDNAPRVLWPAPEAGERVPGSAPALEPFEVVPRSAEAGYLVAKVVAVDADAGRNAWLSYELVQAAEPALFRVGLHSGEVRTARAVSERDAAKQR
ncbi:protocadherin-16-like, partial [Columba livia]